MYQPSAFREERLETLHALIRAHPLAMLITGGTAGLIANLVPFTLADAGDKGTLRAHIAKANDQVNALESGAETLVVFQGPEAYITPSWYSSKHADGKVVPTWNYAVVHAYGQPKAIDEKSWLLQHVTQLTAVHEAEQTLRWEVSDAPHEFIQQMLGAIVGIEIPISKLQGKWKVSQNRQLPDQLGVAAGLESQATDRSLAMAKLVTQRVRFKTT